MASKFKFKEIKSKNKASNKSNHNFSWVNPVVKDLHGQIRMKQSLSHSWESVAVSHSMMYVLSISKLKISWKAKEIGLDLNSRISGNTTQTEGIFVWPKNLLDKVCLSLYSQSIK